MSLGPSRSFPATNLIILGEAPGDYPRYDPKKHALFPYPVGCAGHRLMKLMGLERWEYVQLDRRNLLDYYPGKAGKGAKFPHGASREAVRKLHESQALIGHNVLLVGKRLATAFGYETQEMLTWHHCKAYNYAIVPHTSGINRWWNSPGNSADGAVFLRAIATQARAGALSYS